MEEKQKAVEKQYEDLIKDLMRRNTELERRNTELKRRNIELEITKTKENHLYLLQVTEFLFYQSYRLFNITGDFMEFLVTVYSEIYMLSSNITLKHMIFVLLISTTYCS